MEQLICIFNCLPSRSTPPAKYKHTHIAFIAANHSIALPEKGWSPCKKWVIGLHLPVCLCLFPRNLITRTAAILHAIPPLNLKFTVFCVPSPLEQVYEIFILIEIYIKSYKIHFRPSRSKKN